MYRFFRTKVAREHFDDLVQRTFLGCVEARERFRGEATFRTFLFQVARFQLYAHYRTSARDPRALGTASVRDLATSPTGVLVRKDQQRLLLAALRTLPLDLQIAVELRYWEGLSEPEIATVIDAPRGSVASRLRRAHLSLREAIGQEAPDREIEADTLDNLDRWAESLRQLLGERSDAEV